MRTNKPAATAGPSVPLDPRWSKVLDAAPSDLAAVRTRILERATVPLNPDVVSPAGFLREPDDDREVQLEAQVSGCTSFVTADGTVVATAKPDGSLDTVAFDALHRHAGVVLHAGRAAGPSQLLRIAAQLVMSGVPARAVEFPTIARRVLGSLVSQLLVELHPRDMLDPEKRTDWSVRARRAGFRHFTSLHNAEQTHRVTAVITGADDDVSALVSDLLAQSWPVDDIVVQRDAPDGPTAQALGVREVVHGPLEFSGLGELNSLVLVLDGRHRVDAELVADLVIAQVTQRTGVSELAEVGTYLASVDVTSFSRSAPSALPPRLWAREALLAPVRSGALLRATAPATTPSRQASAVVAGTSPQRSVEEVLRDEYRQVPGPLWSSLRLSPSRPSYFTA